MKQATLLRLKTRAKVLIGTCAPLLLPIAMSGILSFSLNSLDQTRRWVDHTHEVLEQAGIIVASAVDMETGMRGFLLAGCEQFLDP